MSDRILCRSFGIVQSSLDTVCKVWFASRMEATSHTAQSFWPGMRVMDSMFPEMVGTITDESLLVPGEWTVLLESGDTVTMHADDMVQAA